MRENAGKNPAGRFDVLDDLVGATVFLCCSDAARYVTGQLLYIEGGYMASIDCSARVWPRTRA